MSGKDILIVLDFDGLLINSYKLLKITFDQFGLDLGDEDRFRHRRKFLKYVGGGREIIRNLVRYSLPKKKKIRQVLTDVYLKEGRIYPEFVSLLNEMIENPGIHVGIISRNFTHSPGKTIRTVLRNSYVQESELDFVIPVAVGATKEAVIEGMKSTRYRRCVFCADEIGDYEAALDAGYSAIIMASYGFDKKDRLVKSGKVPVTIIHDSPGELVKEIREMIEIHASTADKVYSIYA